MKFYNMEKQEWRSGNFKRGDTWRSEEIYQCKICNIESNNWMMGGWPGMGPRIPCRGSEFIQHKQLEMLVNDLNILDNKINRYKNLNINKLLDLLREEKLALINLIEEFRNKFGDMKLDDVIESCDIPHEIIPYSCSSYYEPTLDINSHS